jgi:hypothetical protein
MHDAMFTVHIGPTCHDRRLAASPTLLLATASRSGACLFVGCLTKSVRNQRRRVAGIRRERSPGSSVDCSFGSKIRDEWNVARRAASDGHASRAIVRVSAGHWRQQLHPCSGAGRLSDGVGRPFDAKQALGREHERQIGRGVPRRHLHIQFSDSIAKIRTIAHRMIPQSRSQARSRRSSFPARGRKLRVVVRLLTARRFTSRNWKAPLCHSRPGRTIAAARRGSCVSIGSAPKETRMHDHRWKIDHLARPCASRSHGWTARKEAGAVMGRLVSLVQFAAVLIFFECHPSPTCWPCVWVSSVVRASSLSPPRCTRVEAQRRTNINMILPLRCSNSMSALSCLSCQSPGDTAAPVVVVVIKTRRDETTKSFVVATTTRRAPPIPRRGVAWRESRAVRHRPNDRSIDRSILRTCHGAAALGPRHPAHGNNFVVGRRSSVVPVPSFQGGVTGVTRVKERVLMTHDEKRNSGRRWVRRTNGSFGSFVICGFGVTHVTFLALTCGQTGSTKFSEPQIRQGRKIHSSNEEELPLLSSSASRRAGNTHIAPWARRVGVRRQRRTCRQRPSRWDRIGPNARSGWRTNPCVVD